MIELETAAAMVWGLLCLCGGVDYWLGEVRVIRQARKVNPRGLYPLPPTEPLLALVHVFVGTLLVGVGSMVFAFVAQYLTTGHTVFAKSSHLLVWMNWSIAAAVLGCLAVSIIYANRRDAV